MDRSLLLRGVRDISLIVDPEHPTAITQRAFDEARLQGAVPNMPRAKRIVEQLNAKRRVKGRLSWSAVLALAHSEEQDQVNTFNSQETTNQTWLTEQQIIFALQYVTRRLGNAAPSADEYGQELRKMRAERIPVDELHLPSGTQIISAMARKLQQREAAFPLRVRVVRPRAQAAATKSSGKPARSKTQATRRRKAKTISAENAWSAALELAGLQEVERASLAPRRVSSIALLDRCWEVYETQLTQRDADIFARANNIPYARDREKLKWSESLAHWKQGLEARGITPPNGPPPIKERPNYKRNVGAAGPGERRRASWATIDALLALVIPYLGQVPANERSSYAGFTHWLRAQGKPVPGESSMQRHGGWGRVREIAYQRMYPDLAKNARARTGKTRTSAKPTAATTPGVATGDKPRASKPTRETPASTPEPHPVTPLDVLRAQRFRVPDRRRSQARRTRSTR